MNQKSPATQLIHWSPNDTLADILNSKRLNDPINAITRQNAGVEGPSQVSPTKKTSTSNPFPAIVTVIGTTTFTVDLYANGFDNSSTKQGIIVNLISGTPPMLAQEIIVFSDQNSPTDYYYDGPPDWSIVPCATGTPGFISGITITPPATPGAKWTIQLQCTPWETQIVVTDATCSTDPDTGKGTITLTTKNICVPPQTCAGAG